MSAYLTQLPKLAAEINLEHRQAEMHAKTALEHAHTAGERLLKARSLCPRGAWLMWLESKLDISKSTAYNYMQLAENWHELEENFQRLEVSGVRQALAQLKDRKTTRETFKAALNAPITPGLLPTTGTVKATHPDLLETQERFGLVLCDPRNEGTYLFASHESVATRPLFERAVLVFVAQDGLPPLNEWVTLEVDAQGWAELYRVFFADVLDEVRWHRLPPLGVKI